VIECTLKFGTGWVVEDGREGNRVVGQLDMLWVVAQLVFSGSSVITGSYEARIEAGPQRVEHGTDPQKLGDSSLAAGAAVYS
jgi:hypothetical protein